MSDFDNDIASLISDITQRLLPFTGEEEKELAEFIIDLHLKVGSSLESFKSELYDQGAEFPDELISEIYSLIRKTHPSYRKIKQEIKLENEDVGLAIPDNLDHIKKLERDMKKEPLRESDHERGRKRHRSPSLDKKQPYQKLSGLPEEGLIYSGKVTGIKQFGAFTDLVDFERRTTGLIHISQLANGVRVNDPSEIVSLGDYVKVKVLSVQQNGRISLSMRQVDQTSGGAVENYSSQDAYSYSSQNQKKRATSQERFEMRQLIASGINKPEDFPELQEDEENGNSNGLLGPSGSSTEAEDLDIEVREEAAPFLKGSGTKVRELSPIRIVKAPEGSMSRSAQDSARDLNYWKEGKRRREKEIEEAKKRGEVIEEEVDDADAALTNNSRWRQNQKTVADVHRTEQTIEEQRKSLPVYQQRSKILKMIKENQIVVIVGHTGSGKTTQITQFLAEDGYTRSGMVGCTQPRRMAAMSVARRVAEEYGCPLGQEVGYNVRFDDNTSKRTQIKYMTDGMLQREALSDPYMSQYSVIVLDEAHERTVATDVLFALLKKAAVKRPDLKIVITSATLNAEKFSSYFLDCPIMEVAGKLFPVSISYSREPVTNYLDAALKTIVDIHLTQPEGDILVFLTGRDEIETCVERLSSQMKSYGPDVPELISLPVFSQMPNELQARIFDPAPEGSRKVILATNIAETSLTIDGIYYVVDPGFVKINAYDPKYGMEKLIVTPISQAQANQRTGRAGRVGPGKCYRLYTEEAYQTEMLANPVPEILRQNLAHTLLMLRAMGINQLEKFEFMDPPSRDSMTQALEQLYQLGALDQEGMLTLLGRRMADFPMEPALAKVLINSSDSGCSEEMLTIVAMLSVQSIFYRPSDKNKHQDAEQAKARFHDPFGDHLTMLNVYNAWVKSRKSKVWCQKNYIHDRALQKAQDVRDQLVRQMHSGRLRVVSCGNDNVLIRKTICSGFFYNSAKKDPQEGYKTMLENTPVYLHPASSLFFRQPMYVIYHTLMLTTKEYMNYVTTIEPKWLAESAPTFFKVAENDAMSKKRRAERIEPLRAKRGKGKHEWRISSQRRIPG